MSSLPLSMVFVNSKKFACESCIKGHRSSSCHHTDRPLFEVKKKGRPVSQCNKCRELRQSKKLHSKCTCDPKDRMTQEQLIPLSAGSKSRRFIPIVPALPNGLKDVLNPARSSCSKEPDSRQKVDSLLNPCTCNSVWKCNCSRDSASSSKVSDAESLTTLARVAAMHDSALLETPSSNSMKKHPHKLKRLHSRPGTPPLATRKRSSEIRHILHYSKGPDLPPILSVPSSSQLPVSIPEFASMPPMSEITSLAGSGCTCGLQCACPGCPEHRGSDNVAKDRRNCADGCGTCIDYAGTTIKDKNLPNSDFLDRFFARAAALPPPPAHRRYGSRTLDPTDVTIYRASESLLSGSGSLPKLECCGGQCLCPSGRCSCGTSCDGSCLAGGPSSSAQLAAATITPPPTGCQNCRQKTV
ncbi:uncharacterized protein LACBIDRAFT_300881 [Laccaria bicolor S238N-H82]|uniref:Predicted protein n=1 Tax=Laccaria bicolor (strain S238N-H82 / ATCC MYA-4686) TaxID=486041 RepID=B0CQT0_LACBS|nr:uncharacterized protein LACBIDRAFT_300881 [Laccaria bicolor S238N-H82]EDR15088.1 predicted protein [Laccaria bicolor S238N-H82]|eukprot:XP_001873296.1 predicted protein [Laccaria bicolor S238N-H82]